MRKKVFAVRHRDKHLEGGVGKLQVTSGGEVGFVRELAINLSICLSKRKLCVILPVAECGWERTPSLPFG